MRSITHSLSSSVRFRKGGARLLFIGARHRCGHCAQADRQQNDRPLGKEALSRPERQNSPHQLRVVVRGERGGRRGARGLEQQAEGSSIFISSSNCRLQALTEAEEILEKIGTI